MAVHLASMNTGFAAMVCAASAHSDLSMKQQGLNSNNTKHPSHCCTCPFLLHSLAWLSKHMQPSTHHACALGDAPSTNKLSHQTTLH